MDNTSRDPFLPEEDSDIWPEEPKKPSGIRRFFYELLETIVLAAVMVLVINALTARIKVDGFSMEPTIHHKNYVIVNKLAYRFGEIQRGDVIVFRFPRNPEEDYIKRVIGLPGDHIEITSGLVYVNDVPLDEPYIQDPYYYNVNDYVSEDALFVMGDNRDDSSDSRAWGELPLENIIGKAVFVYWPLSDAGVVPHYDYDTVFP